MFCVSKTCRIAAGAIDKPYFVRALTEILFTTLTRSERFPTLAERAVPPNKAMQTPTKDPKGPLESGCNYPNRMEPPSGRAGRGTKALLSPPGGRCYASLNILTNHKTITTMKLFDVYPLYDIEIVKALGSNVWDEKGQKYLDFYGGPAVISIGHTHPRYVGRPTDPNKKVGF